MLLYFICKCDGSNKITNSYICLCHNIMTKDLSPEVNSLRTLLRVRSNLNTYRGYPLGLYPSGHKPLFHARTLNPPDINPFEIFANRTKTPLSPSRKFGFTVVISLLYMDLLWNVHVLKRYFFKNIYIYPFILLF